MTEISLIVTLINQSNPIHFFKPIGITVLQINYMINETFLPSVKMYSDFRREDVILARLRIGHSRRTHKQYLLGEDFPECIPCDCRLTIKHILIECIDTVDIRLG